MKSILAVLVATSMMLIQSPVQTQSPRATVDRAVKAYSSIRTIRATFKQAVTNPLTGSEVASSGEMQQRIPGRLSVTFTDPAGDRIVADGKVVWLYLPSTNPGQVIKAKVGENAASVPDVTAWFLDSPATRYRMSDGGTATIAGHATHAVKLVPLDPTIPFARATVWIGDDDALIRQFETTTENGLTRRITITEIRPNAKLDPGAFAFEPPRGVRVVER